MVNTPRICFPCFHVPSRPQTCTRFPARRLASSTRSTPAKPSSARYCRDIVMVCHRSVASRLLADQTTGSQSSSEMATPSASRSTSGNVEIGQAISVMQHKLVLRPAGPAPGSALTTPSMQPRGELPSTVTRTDTSHPSSYGSTNSLLQIPKLYIPPGPPSSSAMPDSIPSMWRIDLEQSSSSKHLSPIPEVLTPSRSRPVSSIHPGEDDKSDWETDYDPNTRSNLRRSVSPEEPEDIVPEPEASPEAPRGPSYKGKGKEKALPQIPQTHHNSAVYRPSSSSTLPRSPRAAFTRGQQPSAPSSPLSDHPASPPFASTPPRAPPPRMFDHARTQNWANNTHPAHRLGSSATVNPTPSYYLPSEPGSPVFSEHIVRSPPRSLPKHNPGIAPPPPVNPDRVEPFPARSLDLLSARQINSLHSPPSAATLRSTPTQSIAVAPQFVFPQPRAAPRPKITSSSHSRRAAGAGAGTNSISSQTHPRYWSHSRNPSSVDITIVEAQAPVEDQRSLWARVAALIPSFHQLHIPSRIPVPRFPRTEVTEIPLRDLSLVNNLPITPGLSDRDAAFAANTSSPQTAGARHNGPPRHHHRAPRRVLTRLCGSTSSTANTTTNSGNDDCNNNNNSGSHSIISNDAQKRLRRRRSRARNAFAAGYNAVSDALHAALICLWTLSLRCARNLADVAKACCCADDMRWWPLTRWGAAQVGVVGFVVVVAVLIIWWTITETA